jgi:hypothetical protein
LHLHLLNDEAHIVDNRQIGGEGERGEGDVSYTLQQHDDDDELKPKSETSM